MIEIASVLTVALLFGGMALFSFGFAAFLFTALPMPQARSTIRAAFPHFYLFVLATAVVGGVLLIGVDTLSALLMGVIAITVVPTRQLLMPAINAATDRGDKSRFKWLHGVSVLITLAHIALAGWALARLV
mgnify:FL=1|jgi:hypothetical protein